MHAALTLELMSLAVEGVQRVLSVQDGYLRWLWLCRRRSIRTCFRGTDVSFLLSLSELSFLN